MMLIYTIKAVKLVAEIPRRAKKSTMARTGGYWGTKYGENLVL